MFTVDHTSTPGDMVVLKHDGGKTLVVFNSGVAAIFDAVEHLGRMLEALDLTDRAKVEATESLIRGLSMAAGNTFFGSTAQLSRDGAPGSGSFFTNEQGYCWGLIRRADCWTMHS